MSLALVSIANNARALILKQTTEELTLNSDRVLTGNVVSMKSEWDPGKTTIYTYVTVSVDKHIKGNPDLNEIVVKIPGGTVGQDTIKVSDVAQFRPNEKVMLFLRQDPSDGFKVTGWHQGKLSIKDNMVVEKGESVEGFTKKIYDILDKNVQGSSKGSPSLMKKVNVTRRLSATMAERIAQKNTTAKILSFADSSGYKIIMI